MKGNINMKCIMRFTGLDYSANMMARAVKNGSNYADRAVGDFLKLANKEGTQGAALTSLFSQARTVGIDSHKAYLSEIEKRAHKNPKTAAEYNKFVSALIQNYPKTIHDRASLAASGAVESGHVKPKSLWNKIMPMLSKLVREE